MKWGIKCVIKNRNNRNKRPGADWELTNRGWEKWCGNGYDVEVHNDINEAHRILMIVWISYTDTSYYVEELHT